MPEKLPPPTFEDAIKRVSTDVARTLTSFEQGGSSEAELHNLRAYIVNVLELVRKDLRINSAADQLFAAATVFASASHEHRPEHQRLLRLAFLRLQDRLLDAKPSDKARHMGLR